MSESRKRMNKSLMVRGTGYVLPADLDSNTRRPPRGPFVMPSAPFKQQPPPGRRIAMAPAASTSNSRTPLSSGASRFGSMTNLTSEQQCRCQHPADLEFLQDVYVENMRMRLEMMELENSYLKNSAGSESNLEAATPSNEKSRSPTTPTRKRVEFADRIFRPSASSQPTSLNSKSTQRVKDEVANDQELFSKLEEAYQKEFQLIEKIKALTAENRKLSASRDDAEQRLRKLSNGEKSFDKERHELMTENVELQRRLDDLTPVVAAKDGEIEKLGMEKAELVSKVRRLSTIAAQGKESGADNRTTSAADLARKQELGVLRERFRNVDVELQQCRQKESKMIDEISTLKRKLKEEERATKREQSTRENYADENAKLIKDNSDLTAKLNRCERVIEKQNRELKSQTESAADRNQVEMSELRAIEGQLRDELNDVKRRLGREMEKREVLKEQLSAQELSEEEVQRSRQKIQDELQGLRALSDSLSAENQGLREDRISMGERMARCYKKLNDKDEQLKQLARRLEEFQRRYEDAMQQIRREAERQNENGLELKSIVHEANELATSSRNAMTSGQQSAESTACELQPIESVGRVDRESREIDESSVNSSLREDSEKRPPLSPVRSAPKAPARRTANRSLPSTSMSRFDSRSSGSIESTRRKL